MPIKEKNVTIELCYEGIHENIDVQYYIDETNKLPYISFKKEEVQEWIRCPLDFFEEVLIRSKW